MCKDKAFMDEVKGIDMHHLLALKRRQEKLGEKGEQFHPLL